MNDHRYFKQTFYIIIGLVLLLTAYAIFINEAGSRHMTKLFEATHLSVDCYHVKKREICAAYEVSNIEVQAQWKIDLRAEIDGTVAEVPVVIGQSVKAGDVLMKLTRRETPSEQADAQAAVSEAEAALTNASQELERKTYLIGLGAVSQQEYDTAMANHKAALAKMASALAKATIADDRAAKQIITAPQDGVVMDIYHRQGYVVQANMPLLLLANTDKLFGRSSFPDELSHTFATGNNDYYMEIKPYMVAFKAYPHNISYSENNIIQGSKKVHVHTRSDADPLRFKLKLHNIMPAFSKKASYRELHWEVQNQNGLLEPTTYRNVIIGSNTPVTTLVLPVSAIRNINSDGEESVFVVDENNVIHSRSVSLGIRNEYYAEIVSGLDEGELVASIGVNSLSDKMTIQPIVKDEENER